MEKEKAVSESRVEMTQVMFPTDANPAGNVHGGSIMKLIDTAAGIAAVRHCRANVVTASMDRLDFHEPVFVGELVILRASINYVGKTSMEVGVRVEAEFVAASDLEAELALAAAGSAGDQPDFVLAPHSQIGPLHEAGLLKEITPLVDPAQLAQYLTASVEALQVEEALYGLPQALDVNALYYNSALVDSPARSGWDFPSRSYLFYNIALGLCFFR